MASSLVTAFCASLFGLMWTVFFIRTHPPALYKQSDSLDLPLSTATMATPPPPKSNEPSLASQKWRKRSDSAFIDGLIQRILHSNCSLQKAELIEDLALECTALEKGAALLHSDHLAPFMTATLQARDRFEDADVALAAISAIYSALNCNSIALTHALRINLARVLVEILGLHVQKEVIGGVGDDEEVAREGTAYEMPGRLREKWTLLWHVLLIGTEGMQGHWGAADRPDHPLSLLLQRQFCEAGGKDYLQRLLMRHPDCFANNEVLAEKRTDLLAMDCANLHPLHPVNVLLAHHH